MQVGPILEQGSGVLNNAIVVLDVVDVDLEKLGRVVIEFLLSGDIDEGEQYSTHATHDLMLLIEPDFIVLVFDGDLLLPLVLVQLHLLEDVYRVLLLLRQHEHLHRDYAVQQVVQVLLGFAGPLEEVLLELFVILVRVLFVYLEGGEGQLAAVDESRLDLVVSEVENGQPSLLCPLVHQCFQAHEVSEEAVFAYLKIQVPAALMFLTVEVATASLFYSSSALAIYARFFKLLI